MPYRDSPIVEPEKPSAWKAPVCWAVGHDWEVTRQGPGLLSMYHPLAGCDAHCKRCGKTWLNYDAVQRVQKELFKDVGL